MALEKFQGWTEVTRVDEGHVISRNAQCAVYSNMNRQLDAVHVHVLNEDG